MTSTEKVTTAVEQALFRLAEDGTASVVASSLQNEQAEFGWLHLVGPCLGFVVPLNSPSPVRAFSYHVFPDGFAAVLRRTWDPRVPGEVEAHALLGLNAQLTSATALSTSDWSGWLDAVPAERGLRLLRLDELRADDTADRLRAQALSQGDVLARSLAWLLQSPGTPLGLVGCPDEDRIALVWALLAIAGPRLPGREWTFSTCGDVPGDGKPAAITFFNAVSEATVVADRIVVDLERGQGASPQNEYRANAMVYRYEYGVDPPDVAAAPAVLPVPAPAPAPVYQPAPVVPRPGTAEATVPLQASVRATLPPWQVAELVRDVVTARDVRALDGALVELEYAVAKIDDRDDVRGAFDQQGWATATIHRHVPFDLRDAVFDRVVRIAFGATGPGRATPAARADARRLASDSDSDDLVRAIARAGATNEIAGVLARRWLDEHTPSSADPMARPGLLGRRRGTRASPKRGRHILFPAALLMVLLLGMFLGAMFLSGVIR